MKEHLALLGELDKKQITTPMEYFLLEILILQLKYKFITVKFCYDSHSQDRL